VATTPTAAWPFVSAADVARELSVHELTVRKWIREGRLPVVRFPNKRVAIERSAFETFKAERDARIAPRQASS
jgi:excisionase family DNA binding protein